MENGPLFDKVKKLGGEKALEELNALVKKDAEWKPSGDANPPEKWKEGHGLRNFKNLKPLRMIPIQIEGASSWLTGSGPFANGSDVLSTSHLTKRSDK